jgi:SSS family solute:Na+ symporter
MKKIKIKNRRVTKMKIDLLLGVIFYLIITLAVGIWAAKKETNTGEDFLVAGRRMNLFVMFWTLLATYVGAASVVGVAGWVYIRGLSQIWYTAGYVICLSGIGYILAGKIRKFGVKTGAATISEFLEFRFGRKIRVLGAILVWFSIMAILAFQYIGMGKILSTITGMNYSLAVILTALIMIAYTTYGGMWSVAITDVFQGIVGVIGLIFMMFYVLPEAGGFGSIIKKVPAEHFSLIGYVTPIQALSAFLVFFLGFVPLPDWWQRAYSSKDEKTAQMGMVLGGLGYLLLAAIVYIIGFCGKVLYPNFADPEKILPTMVIDKTPIWLGAIIIGALLAIIMSTADSMLLIGTAQTIRDLYEMPFNRKLNDIQLLNASRWITAALGILVLIFVFLAPNMFSLWIMASDILGATLAFPVLFGFLSNRSSENSVLISALFGFIGWLAGYLGWKPIGAEPILIGGVLSLIGIVIGDMIFPNKKDLSEILK